MKTTKTLPSTFILLFLTLVFFLTPANAESDKRYIYQYKLDKNLESESAQKPTNKQHALKQLAKQAAKNHQIPTELFLALVQQESSWKPHAVSKRGATGLTQLMPKTAKAVCNLNKWELKDPEKNLNCGAKYLSKQIKRFGLIKKGLCAFNAGPTTVAKLGRCPRYKETQHYVNKLMSALN